VLDSGTVDTARVFMNL